VHQILCRKVKTGEYLCDTGSSLDALICSAHRILANRALNSLDVQKANSLPASDRSAPMALDLMRSRLLGRTAGVLGGGKRFALRRTASVMNFISPLRSVSENERAKASGRGPKTTRPFRPQ
jgi:hypothetical protein